ncbi:MAG: hypothetical protein BWY12_00873 [candidate division BRC1 bacterium ADurb.Bin183]|nr:MAG: hypothetical protein BWY12_00873 [candidate division BRC1 bacterium ADurb.Bin183]
MENFKWFLVAMVVALALALSGCNGKVHIESDPPGATVLYSDNIQGPWRVLGGSHPILTPCSAQRAARSAFFIRLEKEGYHPTHPKLVETYVLNRESISFSLEKTPALIEQEYKEQGLVRYNDKWVNPQEAGLVQYKDIWMTPEMKFAAEQKDKGLVLHNGEWMTAEGRQNAIVEEMTKKGLIPFKGRWGTQEDKEKEEKIDKIVDEVFAMEHNSSDTVRLLGVIPQARPRVSLLNGSGQQVIFYLSGEESSSMPLNPYESRSVDVAAGPYRIATVVVSGDRLSSCWTIDFKPGNRYSILEQGEAVKVERQPAMSPEDIKIKFNIPELDVPDEETSGTKKKGAAQPERGGRRGGGMPPMPRGGGRR